jgi:hypothetical protein
VEEIGVEKEQLGKTLRSVRKRAVYADSGAAETFRGVLVSWVGKEF